MTHHAKPDGTCSSSAKVPAGAEPLAECLRPANGHVTATGPGAYGLANGDTAAVCRWCGGTLSINRNITYTPVLLPATVTA